MWELIETPMGDLKNSEIISLYELLECSVNETHRNIAKKIKTQYELAKHDKQNSIKTWESEGGPAINPQ